MKAVLYRRKIFMRVIFLCEWVPAPGGRLFDFFGKQIFPAASEVFIQINLLSQQGNS